MADGRHLRKIEKLLYRSRGSSNFDEIWQDDAVPPSLPKNRHLGLSFSFSDFKEILQGDTVRPS